MSVNKDTKKEAPAQAQTKGGGLKDTLDRIRECLAALDSRK